MANPIKRLNYFDHQFLRAEDFNDEQGYHLGMRRLHNKLFHAWGIASGMQVTFKPGTSAASVSAGAALDAAGNEIVLTDPATVPDVSGLKGQTVFVTVTYVEQPSDPSTDAGAVGNTRYTESGKIEVVAAPADPSLNLVLSRLVIAGDGTITSSDDGADPNLRRVAGASGGDLIAHSLSLSDANNPAPTWPKLSVANQSTTALTGNLNVAGYLQCNGIQAKGISQFEQNVQISGPLRVDSVTGINQARLFMSGGYGTGANSTWSGISFNAYHNATNDGWVFAEGDIPSVTIQMDNYGGHARFEVCTTTVAANTSWIRRLSIDGETGNVMVGEVGASAFSVGGPAGADVRCDIYGRMRLRQDAATGTAAGLVFLQNSGAGGTVGMDGDGFIGFFSSGVWAMVMDVKTWAVNIVGDLHAKGVALASDMRLKEDIVPLTDPLGKVAAIRGVSYVLSASPEEGRDIGVIAQEVEAVLPELVSTSSRTGMKAVDYCKLTAVLVEAVKQLKQQVDELKSAMPKPVEQT